MTGGTDIVGREYLLNIDKIIGRSIVALGVDKDRTLRIKLDSGITMDIKKAVYKDDVATLIGAKVDMINIMETSPAWGNLAISRTAVKDDNIKSAVQFQTDKGNFVVNCDDERLTVEFNED